MSSIHKSRDIAKDAIMAYRELQNNNISNVYNVKYAPTILENSIQYDTTYGEAYAIHCISKYFLIELRNDN